MRSGSNSAMMVKATYLLKERSNLKDKIGKVMFWCAPVRPPWDPHANRHWDGKIGIWPTGRYTTAQRNSVNRPAGTIEWENETADHEKVHLHAVGPCLD
jgi:hypothetical protein